MSMGGQGGGQPPKYLMLFVYKLNFIIDSLRKTPGAINSTVICKRKQRLGGSGGGGSNQLLVLQAFKSSSVLQVMWQGTSVRQ